MNKIRFKLGSSQGFLSRLRFSYLGILVLVVAANLYMLLPLQTQLQQLAIEAETINVAGRQRMLSQRIGKLTCLLVVASKANDSARKSQMQNQIQNQMKTWSDSHTALRSREPGKGLFPGENPESVSKLFVELDPVFSKLKSGLKQLIANASSDKFSIEDLNRSATSVVKQTDEFLGTMDKIVNRYEENSRDLTFELMSNLKFFMIGISVLLGLTLIFVFEPTARVLKKSLKHLAMHLSAIDSSWCRIELATDGTIVDVNDNFLSTLRYDRHELIGQPFSILESSDEVRSDRHQRFWKNILTGIPESGVFSLIAKDGSTRTLQSTFHPVLKSSGRKISKIAGYLADITENEELKKELKWVQDDVNDALQGAAVGLWRWNRKRKHLWMSNQCKRLLGYDDNELEELDPTVNSLDNWLHPVDRSRIIQSISNHLENGTPFDLEFRLKTKSGSYRWFHTSGTSNLDDRGKPVSMAGSIVDISNQKQTEQELRSTMEELEQATAMANSMTAVAEAANQAKSDFLANMSHEIRTPMTAILGFADILLNEDGIKNAPERRQHALETIHRNGNHLLSLINDILDISKVEAGRMSVECIKTDLPSLISDTAKVVEARANAKGLQTKGILKGPIPKFIDTDPTRLRQILVNLLGNAIKFTESGSVTLSISFDTDDEKMFFEIRDTGIGMTAEQLEKIRNFDSFCQADTTTTRKFGGTGLGLKISNSLSKALGGELKVDSSYGKGSTFTASISTGKIESECEMVTTLSFGSDGIREDNKQNTDEHMTPLQGLNILVAEDGLDNQRLIKFLLSKAGSQVTIAGDGKQAIEQVQNSVEDPFDIVLMDMQMPEIDGYNATRILREQGYSIPIIALTAHAMSGDRKKCIEAGCDDYSTKPIVKNELFSLIQKLTSNRLQTASPQQ